MKKHHPLILLFYILLLFPIVFCSPDDKKIDTINSGNYDDLVRLFKEWREFQKPEIIDGVPDYTSAAMEKQWSGLKEYQERLSSFDITSWPVSQQIDHHIIRAEMNGLDFDHRVLRPWSRNPSFYAVYYSSPSDVPALEGPWRYGTLCLWKYSFPLSDEALKDFHSHIKAIPQVLEQAKTNLTEEAKDLWYLGIRLKNRESAFLQNLAQRMENEHPVLIPDIKKAKDATDEFRAWLEEKQKTMTASSGIGVENYTWYMKNVHLIPYSWEEQLDIIERELVRSISSLKLEENRNQYLPELMPPRSREEYQARFDQAVKYFMQFLKDHEIMTVPDYLKDTLARKVGFIPPDGLRDFFTQIDYHNSLPMRCHGTHWFDLARMEHEPHPSPIRSVPLLYNIWDSRAEGLATGMEEMMMHLGYLDQDPRARELVHILVACRAARAMGDLKMHSNEFTLDEAVDFAVQWTPRGWMPREGNTVWNDEDLYLQQPGYGTSYLVGKVHLEKLIADYAKQKGSLFDLKEFFDTFHSSGLIPLSLIRWEMTGLDDEMKDFGLIK
jgi:hypothetical protein